MIQDKRHIRKKLHNNISKSEESYINNKSYSICYMLLLLLHVTTKYSQAHKINCIFKKVYSANYDRDRLFLVTRFGTDGAAVAVVEFLPAWGIWAGDVSRCRAVEGSGDVGTTIHLHHELFRSSRHGVYCNSCSPITSRCL